MKKKKLLIIGGVLLALCVLAICIFAVTAGGGERKLNAQLELGAKYLEELDYEQAVAAYTLALEIDPKSSEAYLGLAEAYIGLGEYDSAEDVLRQGYERTGDARLQARLEELTSGEFQGDNGQGDPTGGASQSGGETAVGEETENPVKLYQMFEEGNQGGLLSWEELTFFGHSIPDLDYQTARELLFANGFSLASRFYESHENGIQNLTVELGKRGSSAGIMQYDEEDVLCLINFDHRDYYDGSIYITEIRDIGMRDSFAEVLSKLGFTNADAIDAYIREALAVEFHSSEEIVYPGGLNNYYDAAHNSNIEFISHAGTSDDGATYHFSDFSLAFHYWYEGGGSVEFDFDEGFCLEGISIHNSAG